MVIWQNTLHVAGPELRFLLVQLVVMSSKQQVADGIELSQSTECNAPWYQKTTPTGWWQQRNCWEPSLDRCRLRRSCYNFGGQQILAGVVLLQERVDLVLQRLQEQAYGSNIFLQKAFFMLRSTKRLGTIILRRWHQVTSTGLPRRPYLICEYIHKLRQIINDNKYPFISI